MNAILLVGGFGTRLRPLTLCRPKGLMPVLNRPFLSYLIDLFKNTPVENIVFAAGKHNRRWEKKFRSLSIKGIKLHFAYESKPLGTGGAIRFAYDHLKKKGLQGIEPVVVFNGDVFYDINISQLVKFSKTKKSQATIALVKMKDPSRFGVVPFNSERRISKFIEKPHSIRKPSWINGGAYVLDAAWVERIPQGRAVSIEKDSFPQSLKRGDRLFAYLTQGYWNDIGTIEAYRQAHSDLVVKKTRWTRPELSRKRGSNNSIGRLVKIKDKSLIKNSIIFDKVTIEEGASVEGAIIGESSRIGAFAKLREGTVLGDHSVVPPYSVL